MYTKFINPNGQLDRIVLNWNGQEWVIPINEDNQHYRNYLTWLEAGNEPSVEYVAIAPIADEPTPEERLAALELVVSMVFAEDDVNV